MAQQTADREPDRSMAQEARAGAARMRRMAQPEAGTWRDCDRWNGPDDLAERAMAGQARERRWRAERDAQDDERSPYRPDDRPWPILAAARHPRAV